ncbi:peptidase inhibitor family I36 protein [Salinibacterium sp.]|uniref:peptidase inhibitor family I36 protein n=1 Tax=Salinibacterium sp. TaxID=1915057 RepID=UPI00286B13A7|nr:peptidase inhibitor family I36 protein [Salinibacterium sp.]
MNTCRRAIGAAFAAALLAALTLTTTPALASPADPLEARTAQVLASHPGGEEIAPGVISWDGGAVVLTLEGAATARAIGTCATGQYCAWSGTSYTGTKLAFTSCSSGGTSSSLSLLSGLARSTANARTFGSVDAVSGSSVIYSMSTNTGRPSNGTTLSALVCYS